MCWHVPSRSRWAFWINSRLLCRDPGHKGPTAGRGGGGSVGSPAPGAPGTIRAFTALRRGLAEAGDKGAFLALVPERGARQFPGQEPRGTEGQWEPQGTEGQWGHRAQCNRGARFQAPPSSRPLSEPQSPTCKPTRRLSSRNLPDLKIEVQGLDCPASWSRGQPRPPHGRHGDLQAFISSPPKSRGQHLWLIKRP